MLVLKHLARIVWPVMTASKRAASTGAKPSPKKLKSDAALTHELLEHPTIKTIQSWNMKDRVEAWICGTRFAVH